MWEVWASLAQTAAAVTRTQISGGKWMDGWMIFISSARQAHIMLTVVNSTSSTKEDVNAHVKVTTAILPESNMAQHISTMYSEPQSITEYTTNIEPKASCSTYYNVKLDLRAADGRLLRKEKNHFTVNETATTEQNT